MEFSTQVLDGLHLAGDSAHIPDKCFSELTRRVCEDLMDQRKPEGISDDSTFSQVNKPALKQAYASLMTLVLEGAKFDSDSSSISSILEDCKFSADRIKSFTNIYIEKKPYLQSLLGSIGTGPPHIVDVDWRLDYYIKNNHLDKVNEPTYLITLKTEQSGMSGSRDVQFACSMEQLQDLVGKLKDATKSLEKASQN